MCNQESITVLIPMFNQVYLKFLLLLHIIPSPSASSLSSSAMSEETKQRFQYVTHLSHHLHTLIQTYKQKPSSRNETVCLPRLCVCTSTLASAPSSANQTTWLHSQYTQLTHFPHDIDILTDINDMVHFNLQILLNYKLSPYLRSKKVSNGMFGVGCLHFSLRINFGLSKKLFSRNFSLMFFQSVRFTVHLKT